MAGPYGTNSTQKKLRRLTTAALATALVFLFTFFIRVPTGLGYIHLGDALVLLFAAATGDPLALLVGALGEGLADLAGGYFNYLPATVLIKALIALPVLLFARKAPRETPLFSWKTILWTLPSVPITLAGYFAADWVLARAYAFADLATNAVQAVGSIVLFVLLAAAFDRADLRHRL